MRERNSFGLWEKEVHKEGSKKRGHSEESKGKNLITSEIRLTRPRSVLMAERS